MQHYLTKWELYVLFVEYLRFQQIPFSPAVYCFKARRQLATLQEQLFFQTNPDITGEEFKKIARLKNAELIVKRSHNRRFNVYFHNRKLLRSWLADYLANYRADKLHSRRELFSTYRQSMRRTLDLLREYANINEKRIILKPEIEDGGGKVLRADTRTRLYEDILFMIQHEYLALDDVILHNTKVLLDIENKDEVPSFSLRLTFLKPIEEIEKLLRDDIGYTHSPAEIKPKEDNIDTQKILQKLNALEIQAKPQNEDEEDDPNSYLGLRIENKKIYYKDDAKPLQFREGSKEMKLVKHLIKQKEKPSHRDDLMDVLGLTAKKNKRKKKFNMYDNDTIRGPQPNIRKRNLDKLRKLIKVVSDKLSDVKLTIIKTEKRCILLQKLDK